MYAVCSRYEELSVLKKFFSFMLIIFLLSCNVTVAAEKVKFYAGMQTEFHTDGDKPDVVEFMVNDTVKVSNELEIPAGAIVSAKVHEFQKERRWHKSGFFICNLLSYYLTDEKIIDLADKEIYFIARKYEALDKKEAGILGTEIVLTQAASIVGSCFIIFAPVDIAYFFTKGAIIRKKNPNWFRSGVMEAYDNSIFWFWLKGKPIELAEGDELKLNSINKEKAEKINSKICLKNEKRLAKNEKKLAKKEKKLAKKRKETI